MSDDFAGTGDEFLSPDFDESVVDDEDCLDLTGDAGLLLTPADNLFGDGAALGKAADDRLSSVRAITAGITDATGEPGPSLATSLDSSLGEPIASLGLADSWLSAAA